MLRKVVFALKINIKDFVCFLNLRKYKRFVKNFKVLLKFAGKESLKIRVDSVLRKERNMLDETSGKKNCCIENFFGRLKNIPKKMTENG